jgi:hypothetical protein
VWGFAGVGGGDDGVVGGDVGAVGAGDEYQCGELVYAADEGGLGDWVRDRWVFSILCRRVFSDSGSKKN